MNYEAFSTITCPACGHAKRELMPTNACRVFYECEGCGTLLRPDQGDCCVYCSHGDTKCRPSRPATRAANERSRRRGVLISRHSGQKASA